MKVLIIEDEPNYADTLEMFVDELGYNITDVVGEGQQALKAFRNEYPDLVLLDINLEGEMTGIDLARAFQAERKTPIIFITSFDDKETFQKAKETAPHAYLIKPFNPDELERSMELALLRTHGPNQEDEQVLDNGKHAILAKNSFFIKERNKLVKVNVSDILWVSVEDKYSILHTADKRFVLRQSLKEVAEKLDDSIFVQVHRSHIVNISTVEDIDLQLFTISVNGEEVPLGKSYKDNLVQRLQML
ncbi:LytR/AlgR family response regulator transcription factor [Roseivirga pacifica]|uniref:LytR/AlgR family response regulator transcription factor n=1 Tax=Roseivirga pacifica TaxID=1267423 RepID=UPI00227B040A|nr:response regulator [Roseivirga pacifica]